MSNPSKNTQVTFEEATEAIMKYMTDRHWENNPPRSLAISIALEANELLEHYQWQEKPVGNTAEIAEELADILIYSVQFADRYNIDIPQAMMQKLAKTSKKYPLEIFGTTDPAKREGAWLKAKKNYKKDTTL